MTPRERERLESLVAKFREAQEEYCHDKATFARSQKQYELAADNLRGAVEMMLAMESET